MLMKKSFEGMAVSPQGGQWREKTGSAQWLSGQVISVSSTPEHVVNAYIHPQYFCCEYRQGLNIFSFGKLRLTLPFTVIAPPVSVDETGFGGDLAALVADYKCRKGLFLMLNLKDEKAAANSQVAVGKTLPSCIFTNRFDSFDAYLTALRSGYRRRIKTALAKGRALTVRQIDNAQFDEQLYKLYLQVLAKSDYPLERLPISFFQCGGCTIEVFYQSNTPLAFVMYQQGADTMSFVFGGMDYKNRDRFDLYYNMLLRLVKVGIDTKVRQINFGQTAEGSKCRIGCKTEDRYMVAFCGNRVLNRLLCLAAPLLQNNQRLTEYKVFKYD